MLKKISTIIITLLLLSSTAGCSTSSSSGPSPVEEAESLWAELLSIAVIETEFLDPAGEMMNAVTGAISVQVNDADDSSCNITVTYPDAASLLTEKIDTIPEDMPQDLVNKIYLETAEAIISGQCSMLEETFEIGIQTEKDGRMSLQLTAEAIIALTGGIAGMQ